MYDGQTRATLSEKTGRGKGRDFMQIFSDQFIGRIGEIALKKYLKKSFKEKIILDWEISNDLNKYKSDIVNSKVPISIKSTDTLESAWAESPVGRDYGVFVKVTVPKDFFLKLLCRVGSLTKFLEFMKNIIINIRPVDEISIGRLKNIREKAINGPLTINALICGFFKTDTDNLVDEKDGTELPYLGKVIGKKHMVVYTQLMNSIKDWKKFLKVMEVN
jgi:hypothetical protein